MTTLLDALRQTSRVDCDTLDANALTIQAIAFSEISRPLAGEPLLHHDALIKEAIQGARGAMKELQGAVTFEEFVVQILTNPKLSYSTVGTISDAHRIVAIFKHLAPDFDTKRVCIKIPATWEGLQACRTLEMEGIATLATTMFCMEQAALAAEAQCTYIAPYVNELKVHFEAGYVDQNKAFDFCREAQAYYINNSLRTQVLAASLTSTDEVMQLAGIQHVTISPNLLNGLASTDLSAWNGKLGDYFAQGPTNKSSETKGYHTLVKDESAWRIAFTRSGFGSSEGKIIQAINYFADCQEKLEELIKVPASLDQDENNIPYAGDPGDRIDLLIDPESESWAQRHEWFIDALDTDISIDSILRTTFTRHEALMLMPSDRPDIKELHDANTKRYKALLAGRFKHVEDSLATKLTMAYFGLPVAPMENPLLELAKSLGLEQEEVPRYKVRPPLHFLTAHDRRNWGKDSLKAPEAQNYPIQIPKTSEPILSLRGGDTTVDSQVLQDYFPKDEMPTNANEEWVYLYGVNGRIPFAPRKWFSFSCVLRQLLHTTSPSIDGEDNGSENKFSLLVYDLKIGKPQIIHDSLPLTKESPVMTHLQKHFASNGKHTQKDCCTLFADQGWTEVNRGPELWEPLKQQLELDTVRIGRSLGYAPNGPEQDAISYAYIAFPKTKGSTFVIGKYASNQYNAHLRAAIEVLFGIPRHAEHNHALFRIFDRNKPKAVWEIPIIYGGMGLPQWAWELLHPLNNPGACWMVECCWLEPDVDPIILPNYYPLPNPHLVSEDEPDTATYEQAHSSLTEIITEAFDLSTVRKVNAISAIDGDLSASFEYPLEGLHFDFPIQDSDEAWALGRKLRKRATWFLMLHVNWSPGHCRLFPDWYSGGKVSVEMPPLTSELKTFQDAIHELCLRTQYERDPRKDHILLKETPSVDSIQVQDMDSPAYLITPETSENDWLRIRRCITSPSIIVSFFRKTEVDWTTCIARSNIWGPRVSDHDNVQDRRRWKRDVLEIKSLDGHEVDLHANYPGDPYILRPVEPVDEEVTVRDSRIVRAASSLRESAFRAPELPKAGAQAKAGSITLQLPNAPVLSNQSATLDDEEHDIGIRATERPYWVNKHIREFFDENSDASSEEEPTEDHDSVMEDDLAPGEEEEEENGDDMDVDDYTDQRRYLAHEAEEVDEVEEEEHIITSLPGPFTKMPGSDETVGRDDRGRTWAIQPSLFDGTNLDAWPSADDINIPLTAAPVEKIHRISNNVPMVSKAILTATEQAELQRSLWDARNMLLKRTMQCPFENCDFTFRLDDHEARSKHTRTVHQSWKCPWCDESLFEWWDAEQKDRHMREKHGDRLKTILGLSDRQDNAQRFTNTRQSQQVNTQRIADRVREELRPSPKLSQPPRLLAYPLPWYDTPGPAPHIDPLKKCSYQRCPIPEIEHLSSDGVWKHYKLAHPDHKMDACPFCRLPFRYDAGKDEKGELILKDRKVEECIKHFDCHIYKLWDILEPPGKKSGKVPGLPTISMRNKSAAPQTTTTTATTAQPATTQPASTQPAVPQAEKQTPAEFQLLKKCAFFEKCGAYIGGMTVQQYRRHIRGSHGKEVQILASDDEDGRDEAENEEPPRPITPTPRPPVPKPTPRKPLPPPKQVTQAPSDTEIIDAPADESTASAVVVPAKKTPAKTKTHKPRPVNDSEAETVSDVASTVSRGRRSSKVARPKPATAAPAGDTQGSGSKSSVTEGRASTAKKSKTPRPAGEDDGDYEDDGAETDEYDEEQLDEGVTRRRRARSPDWVKKLGPGDPDFDPDDDMYCSKCLRKAPKRRSKSPNRSPIGRARELEFHTDKDRCCGIRNGRGSAVHLPNRSGWIRARDLPKKLGDIKEKFRRRYPTYTRTLYPTKASDNYASVWRSDPNNEDNMAWWDIPWPPYEGLPPFPGSWEAPDLPWDDTAAGRKRREQYIGQHVHDPAYRYSSDSDSDDGLRPDEDDLAELQSDISVGQKRRASASTSANDTDAPAAKKAKKNKTGMSPRWHSVERRY
ncbi:hypothetical protein BKA59DRAFT_394120 [Fusarium tricinctum]|uniref:Transaldolase n=1 Tax=Fusarium tricinctum TaxID=61284 RepID=A0A8K0S1J6_9HYPO|nr:hypothetical protein BKA59DRAFT_394120 [Fusarium tricinctum]